MGLRKDALVRAWSDESQLAELPTPPETFRHSFAPESGASHVSSAMEILLRTGCETLEGLLLAWGYGAVKSQLHPGESG